MVVDARACRLLSGIFACRLERKRAIEAGAPSDEEEATEEGNFGVRVDVCPRDKSNEIHYNRDVKLCSLGATASIYILFPGPPKLALLASLHH